MENNSNHFYTIDFLRAIACIGVCAIHLHYGSKLSDIQWANKIFTHGQQGVPIFFVVSGFIIPYSLWKSGFELKNFGRFILKRSLRIDPPYLTVIFISFIFAFFSHSFQFDWVRFVLHLFYLIPFTFGQYEWFEGVFWTLGIELQYYILIGLLFPFIKAGNKYVLMIILIVLSCIGYFIPIETSNSFIFKHIHFFCLGIICCIYSFKKINAVEFNVLLLLICLFLATNISLTTGIIGYVTALLIAYSNINNPISNFFGKISYSLYLTHSFSGGIILIIFKGWDLNSITIFTLMFVVSILLAYLFYLAVEKPSIDLSKKITLKKHPA